MNAEKVKIIKKSFKKWIISTVSMLLMILVLKFTFPVENETDFIKGAVVFAIGDLVAFLWFKIKISITSDED